MVPCRRAGVAMGGLLFAVRSMAWGQDAAMDEDVTADSHETTEAVPDQWIDRAHRGVHALVWKSAMHIDRMFGAALDEEAYRTEARGSITPALLWDEFHGLDEKFRFRVRLPFPYLDERYDAFVGTFNRDEVVTERQIASGAIPQQHVGGQTEKDQTLLGVRYRPKEGGRFDAGAGIRLGSPIDPFVKVGYRYERGTHERIRPATERDCLLGEQRAVRSDEPHRPGTRVRRGMARTLDRLGHDLRKNRGCSRLHLADRLS